MSSRPAETGFGRFLIVRFVIVSFPPLAAATLNLIFAIALPFDTGFCAPEVALPLVQTLRPGSAPEFAGIRANLPGLRRPECRSLAVGRGEDGKVQPSVFYTQMEFRGHEIRGWPNHREQRSRKRTPAAIKGLKGPGREMHLELEVVYFAGNKRVRLY